MVTQTRRRNSERREKVYAYDRTTNALEFKFGEAITKSGALWYVSK